ncbi:hypothetical protein [Actinoplanes sp. TFC3]|uniref:hypothetical protein n=1 Tax=Actinoplanes sp. TFC3 TaxID=1710355 RepID=UPI0008322332|nr:hypothetical protein [Actinoplanes sp. TFC3]
MGELADRVDSMRVRASTPDKGIIGELYSRDQLSLSFQEGLYQLLDDEALERRLAVLANLLWVARTREYSRIYADITGDYSVGEEKPISERDIAWQTERDSLEVSGSSADGRLTVRSVGMRQWDVAVQPGTARELDEHQLSVAVGEAAGALIRQQFAGLAALSNKYYGDER